MFTYKITSIFLIVAILMNVMIPAFAVEPLTSDDWKYVRLTQKGTTEVISEAQVITRVDKVNHRYNPKNTNTELTFRIQHTQNFALMLYWLKDDVSPESVSQYVHPPVPPINTGG